MPSDSSYIIISGVRCRPYAFVRSFVRSLVRANVIIARAEICIAMQICAYNRVIISRPPDCSTGGACLEKNKTPNVQTSCCQSAEARPKVERSLSRAKLK